MASCLCHSFIAALLQWQGEAPDEAKRNSAKFAIHTVKKVLTVTYTTSAVLLDAHMQRIMLYKAAHVRCAIGSLLLVASATAVLLSDCASTTRRLTNGSSSNSSSKISVLCCVM
jgi:hypothetical protein